MCWPPRPTARSSPRSPESCTCPRARSATTCRPASRRPGPATAPKPCTSPRNAAGSDAYDDLVTSAGYLLYPHLRGILLPFAADDDVWLAPAAGGQAWRLSAEGAAVSYPRISPDGRQVAWTTSRDQVSEIYLAGLDGTGYRPPTWGG